MSSSAIVVDSIQHDLVISLRHAGDREASAITEMRVFARNKSAGNEIGELREVASIQRQIDDLSPIHDRRHCGIFRFDQGSFRSDFDVLTNIADHQLKIDTQSVSDLQSDTL